MDRLQPPAFNFQGDVGATWKEWKHSYNSFMAAKEDDFTSDKIKTSILLTCMGDKGREIYEAFKFSNVKDKYNFAVVMDKFDSYFLPGSSTTIARQKFFTYRQSNGQSFTDFVKKLKELSADCAFVTLEETLKDRIVCGVADNLLRERMLHEPNINLEKAIKLGEAFEIDMRKSVCQYNRRYSTTSSNDDKRFKQNDIQCVTENCKCCTGAKALRKRPTYKQRYNRYNQKNHLPSCHSRNGTVIEKPMHDFPIPTILQDSSSEEEYYADVNKTHNAISLETNGKTIKYMIDKGTQDNILPRYIYDKLVPRPPLKSSVIKLSAYNNSGMQIQSQCISPVIYKNKVHYILFIVLKTDRTPILGYSTCEQLNLVKPAENVKVNRPLTITEEFGDCFGNVSTIDKIYHIYLKGNVKTDIVPIRKIPDGLHNKLNKELERMEELGIIEKIVKPTRWMNDLVTIEKPNRKLQVCLDPRPLNKAIQKEYHKFPTAKEIITQISGAQFFSQLVASSGSWQIQVDDSSSNLLAFRTPFAMYKFRRIPNGIHTASNIFEAEVSKLTTNMEGVANLQDDIIVWGRTKENHDENLIQVLTWIRDSGFKLNYSKCIFGTRELVYLGHIISAGDVRPDLNKIKAITNMPIPSNKFQLQRFLSMAKYIGKSVPNLSEVAAPLRLLLKNDNVFMMQKAQLHAVNKLKSLITSTPILMFYDPNLPTLVQTASSSEGLGAMIEQSIDDQWFPIAFASRELSNSERDYEQIERDYLSVLFACEYFREYVYGREFVVQNDHQPLKEFLSGAINEYPPQMQYFYLRLQRYNFSFAYPPGKKMVVADALSRAYLRDNQLAIDEGDLAFTQ